MCDVFIRIFYLVSYASPPFAVLVQFDMSHPFCYIRGAMMSPYSAEKQLEA